MPDLWFFAGLVMGVVVTGFCAVGSFDRGADSVRRKAWSRELSARQQAFAASTPVPVAARRSLDPVGSLRALRALRADAARRDTRVML